MHPGRGADIEKLLAVNHETPSRKIKHLELSRKTATGGAVAKEGRTIRNRDQERQNLRRAWRDMKNRSRTPAPGTGETKKGRKRKKSQEG